MKTTEEKTAPEQLWDAIAINIETGKVRLFGERKTFQNAEAISKIAVMRRGVETEFYAEVHTGTYKEGDEYIAGKNQERTPGDDGITADGRLVRIGDTFYPNGPRGL